MIGSIRSAGREAGKLIREMEPNRALTLEASMLPEDAGRGLIELEVSDAAGNRSSDTVEVEGIG